MKTLCEKCHLRSNCNELCDTASRYADQDYTPQKRNHIRFNDSLLYEKRNVSAAYLSKRERQIVTLYSAGLTRLEITEQLGITRNFLRKQIHVIKKKLRDW